MFKKKPKLERSNHVRKTVVGDFDFKFLKKVKIIVDDYSFRLKVKTVVGDYNFKIFLNN